MKVLAAALLLFTACSSTPTLDPAPVTAPAAGRAKLYVIRAGSVASLYAWTVVVDGATVGTLPVRSNLAVDLSTGEHSVMVIFGGGGSSPVLRLSFAAGETRFVNVSNHFDVTEIDAATGSRLVAGSRRVQTQ